MTADTIDSPIPVAVVGIGRMGNHHSRVYSQIPGAKLVAVVDANAERARKAAEQYGCRAFATVEELVAAKIGVRAATVSVPTSFHLAMARVLLENGIDVLVEKPLAPSVAEARAIVETAAKHGRVVQVGHSERFNPAMVALAKFNLRPQFVEVHRVSPMTFRSIDIGVVLDMMIHDIDIVHSLVQCPAVEVKAVGVGVIGNFEDIANARIVFANGCVANMTASRLALKTERKMRLFSPMAYVSVDFQKKSGAVIMRTANEETLHRVREQVRTGEIADLTQLNYPEIVKYEDLQVVEAEPLRAQAEAFLQAVRARTRPIVSGEDGLAAVDIAAQIGQAIAEHKWEGAPALVQHPRG